MTNLINLNKAQFAAVKAAAKVELAGIKLVVKHRTSGEFGPVDIYSRADDRKWDAAAAERVYAFVLAQGFIGCTGEMPRKESSCYEGLRYLKA